MGSICYVLLVPRTRKQCIVFYMPPVYCVLCCGVARRRCGPCWSGPVPVVLPAPVSVILLFSLFQVISLEGWVDIMYYVQDAHSFWDWIYFVLLIVVSKTSSKRVCFLFLQVISLAGWVNIMYFVQDAHSFWDWTYFVSLIVVSPSSWALLA